MQKSALFDTKNSEFFQIYGVSAQTRELSQCGHFADKEKVAIFRDFVQTSYMNGLLLNTSFLI